MNTYNKLQSSTYCKPFVKAGNSVYEDGVKKYYSSPSFSNGTPLGVNRYLNVENNGTSIYYYFLGDGTDGTIVGNKYYIRPDEVINNYLVPFKTAIIDDKIIEVKAQCIDNSLIAGTQVGEGIDELLESLKETSS